MGIITIYLPGVDDMSELRQVADRIYDGEGGECRILVEPGDQPSGIADGDGVWCEGCSGHAGPPGVRWPTAPNGDGSRQWVERCDTCERYDSDETAASAVLGIYRGTGAAAHLGHARPAGLDAETPYVEVG